MFDCDEFFTFESDESLPPSPIYDRYQSGDGYHVVPPPYTGTFTPPEPDLVFHNAPNVNETDHTAFNVKLSLTKSNNDLSHTHRPSTPIIKDLVSDSEDDSEAEIPQNAPSFVQPIEQVKTPRPFVKTVRTSIPTANTKIAIRKPKSNGDHRNRNACFVLLTQSKLVPITVARLVTAFVPKPYVTRPRHAKSIVTKPRLPPKRHINHRPSPKASNFPPKLLLLRFHMLMLLMGNPQHALKHKGVIDSRCSRYMTGNMSYLSNFEELNGGYVAFGGNPKGGKIFGKGKIRTEKLDFDDVYFVKELKFNLFSVSQMCDKKNIVLFTDTECLILSPDFKLPDENQVLLRVPRENNMYNVDLKNIVLSGDLTCLFAKATLDESNLWHRRLGHINFKTMNKLVKGNLVRGLPSKVFKNDHTCVACKKGKQHRGSCKTKPVSSVNQPLQRLHMYLFGPTFVKSLNKKSYCLVVIDDYSRFIWVFFLAPKDETSPILKTFITGIENQLSLKGTEKESSVPRTPQKNGIAERKNRTLIETARTMLADLLLPIPFWAEAVNAACYVQNRVLVTKTQNKTPYELLLGITPSIGFMKPFGCPVTILNTLDPLGSGPTWLFDIHTLTKTMNYQLVTTGNQSNPSPCVQEQFDAKKAGEENVQQYVLFLVCSSGSNNPQNTNGDAAFEVKEPEFERRKPQSEVHVSPSSSAQTMKHDDKTKKEAKGKSPVKSSTGYRNLSAEFEDFSNNSINEVNAVDSLVPAVGQISTDNTNTFSVAGPLNTAVSPTHGKSSYVNTSQYLDDLNMRKLEDITYSDDEEDVGAEADLTNLETTIIVSHIPITRVHNDHLVTQIIGDLSSATQIKSMTRVAKDQDPSWIEAMQEELLQFKMQKVWDLVDLPHGKRAIDEKSASIPIDTKKPLLKDADVAYSDSDYVGVSLDMKSTIGGCQFLGCILISWQCKKPTVVATSSTEADMKSLKRNLHVTNILSAGSITTPQMVINSPCLTYIKNWLVQIKQFLTSVSVKKVNDVTRFQALVDKKKVIITEAIIRDALRLNDAESIDCLPNEEIFADAKRTSWNEFSSSMASAVICLFTGRKFNVCKYIFDSLVINVDSSTKRFLQLIIREQVGDLSSHSTKYYSPALTQKVFANMRRVGKVFSGVDTPLFEGMIVVQQVDENAAEVNADDVHAAGVADEGAASLNVDVVLTIVEEPSIPLPPPTTQPPPPSQDVPFTSQVQPTPPPSLIDQPSSPQQQPQPSQDAEISMDLLHNLLDTCTTFTRRVENLEQNKIAQALEITKLKQRVKKLERRNKLKRRIIDSMDADVDVTLKDVVDITKEVAVDTEIEESANVQGRQANATITAASPTLTTAPSATRRRKGVVIRDPKETATLSIIIHSEAKSKDKGKDILVEEPKPLKKQAQIKQDEAFEVSAAQELQENILSVY
nr:putative ribonuclease H-like domain-containing protein [Tanacetum cinerariifolium]